MGVLYLILRFLEIIQVLFMWEVWLDILLMKSEILEFITVQLLILEIILVAWWDMLVLLIYSKMRCKIVLYPEIIKMLES